MFLVFSSEIHEIDKMDQKTKTQEKEFLKKVCS